MFYVRYLRNELVRRRGRTIVTLLGLGVGVALVIVLSSLSNGLDQAQAKTLNPLADIGTDLTVTLQPQQQATGGFGGGTFGGPGGGGGNRDLVQANLSVVTDLSKLGKPGAHFVHDFFLPGTQLTFKQSRAQQIASINGVAQVTQGLTLLAEHQEGVVPKIVAKLKTGGQTFSVTRNIPRPTAAQFAQMQACMDKLRQQNGGSSNGNNNNNTETTTDRAEASAGTAAAATAAAGSEGSTAGRSRSAFPPRSASCARSSRRRSRRSPRS